MAASFVKPKRKKRIILSGKDEFDSTLANVETHLGTPLMQQYNRDVAPTILDLMGIEKPIEMTGVSIIRA